MIQSSRSLPFLSALLLVACNGEPGNKLNRLYPDMAVLPEAVAFGEIAVQYSAEPIELQILNAGRAPLEIEDITLEGVEGETFTFEVMAAPLEGENYKYEVAVDETLTVVLDFTPETFLEYNAELLIVSNDRDNPELRVPVTGEGVDGDIPNIVVSPQSLDFGEVDVDGPAIELDLDVFNKGDGDLIIYSTTLSGSGAFKLTRDLQNDENIQPDGSNVIEIAYDPTNDLGDCATLTINSNDPDQEVLEVLMLGNGGGACEYPVAVIACPTELIDPPTNLTLDGSGSYDPMGLDLVTYYWTLDDKPDGSTSEIDDPNAPFTGLNIDAAGEWTVGLQVVNEIDLASTITECTFQSAPDEKIYVELSWNTGDSDLDLHLTQSGSELFELPGDLNWCNRSPSWGESGDQDDPALSLDNIIGYGPESLNLPDPYEGNYYINVHYYQNNGGGTTTATVRVYLNGTLFDTYTQVMTHNQVWEVGYIRWPEAVVVESDKELYKQDTDVRNCY